MNDEEYVVRKKRADDLLDEIEELPSASFLPSAALKKKEEKKEVEVPEYFDMEWIEALESVKPDKGKYKPPSALFEGKKKKKKKKKDGDIKEYDSEFDREIQLLYDILSQETKLSSSLQARYDQLDRQKSSARGVGKFTTDLITTLNNSRSLCKDVVKEIAAMKKNVIELNMKERAASAKNLLGDGDDINQFASRYLHTIMGKTAGGDAMEGEIEDVENMEDFYNDFSSVFNEMTDRTDEANQYIKYENRNVKVMVEFDPITGDKKFVAVDGDGNVLDDYPLPSTIDSVSINTTTGYATDKLGQRFPLM